MQIKYYGSNWILCWFTVLTLIFLAGCSGSSDPGDMLEGPFLKFDGDQDSAPSVTPGTWEIAARFTASDIGSYAGSSLSGLYFYIASRPDAAMAKVYGPGNASSPGTLLYSADITSCLRSIRWLRHDFSSVIPLGSDDIWISIEVTLPSGGTSVGCDAGPASGRGDWLYSASNGQWRTFQNRTGESVNWNVRGIVAE